MIAILATIVGMLVPAVQQARESARLAHCRNNLRQLGQAIQLRHNSLQRIPRGRSYNNLRSHSWFVHLLPFLEQTEVFNRFTTPLTGVPTQDGVNDPSNSTFRATGAPQTVIPQMLCPSSARTTKVTIDTSVAAGLACGDYAANYGSSYWVDDSAIGATANGAFPLLMFNTTRAVWGRGFDGLRFEQIRDGLSNTLFLGEKFIPPNEFGRDDFDNTIYTAMGHHNSMRGGREEGLALGPYDTSASSQLFGSYHPTIVPFVFGDGRVQTLSTDIAGSVLELLSERNDRQPIPAY